MKEQTQNTFQEGINLDSNPLTTPNTTLTDCLNGTLITYHGDEFTLQSDFGNGKVETASLKSGFIPLGLKESNGIIYIVSYNPLTNETEFGSFPSPERNFSTYDMQSNDPMGSQGIGTINFTDSDFITNGSMSLTKIKRDLLNFTKFKLSPGDKYIVYYVDQVGWNTFKNYVTDIQKRKIFKVKLMRISDNGISEIKDSRFFSETEANMAEDEGKFSVYTENSSGGIAVLLELETIDYFQMSVAEKIDTTNIDVRIGKISIASKFKSDVKLYGFKLDIRNLTDPTDTVYTKYISLPASVSIATKDSIKFNMELHGFKPTNEYEFTATPFSQFNLYNEGEYAKHINKVNFTFGKNYNLEQNAFESKSFKYYVDSDDVTITFDSYLNTPNTIASCYVEFYDTWSNVSTVVKINEHENGMQTTAVIPLSKEQITQNFDVNDIGGIPLSNLKTVEALYVENEFLKVVLPTMGTQFQNNNVIKADGKLRKNAFYIVRISLIEVITDGDSATVNYYDVYRCMKTTPDTNDLFTDANIINMSSINQNNININYIQDEPIISQPVIKEDMIEYNNVDNFTNKNGIYYAYKISETTISNIEFKIAKKYTCTSNYKCIFNIDKSKFINLFGIKKKLSIDVSTTNLNKDDKLLIEDIITINGDTSLANKLSTNSKGVITNVISNFTEDKLTLDIAINAETNRMGYATSKSKIEQITGIERITIWDTFNETVKNNKALAQTATDRKYGEGQCTCAIWDPIGYYCSPFPQSFKNKNMFFQYYGVGDIAPILDSYKIDDAHRLYTKYFKTGGSLNSYDLYTGISSNVTIKSGFVIGIYANCIPGAFYYYPASGKAVSFLLPSTLPHPYTALSLMMVFKDESGNYGLGFVPDPLVPTEGITFDNYYSFFEYIKTIFNNIGTAFKVDKAYNTYTTDNVLYHDNTKTIVKLNEINPSFKVNVIKSAASSMIFKALGISLIDTDIQIIKNYINSKITNLSSEFKNLEKINNDVTTKISNKYFPKIEENNLSFNIKLNDYTIPITQTSVNLILSSLMIAPSKLNDDLNERQEISTEIGNVVAFDTRYKKYIPYFHYNNIGNFFYYKVNATEGRLTLTKPMNTLGGCGNGYFVLSSLLD